MTDDYVYIQAKVPIRELASLILFYRDNGITLQSRNAFANRCILDYAKALRDSDLLEEVKSDEEALQILNSVNFKRPLKSRKLSNALTRVKVGALRANVDNEPVPASVLDKVIQDSED